jgi:hypothetical protein
LLNFYRKNLNKKLRDIVQAATDSLLSKQNAIAGKLTALEQQIAIAVQDFGDELQKKGGKAKKAIGELANGAQK